MPEEKAYIYDAANDRRLYREDIEAMAEDRRSLLLFVLDHQQKEIHARQTQDHPITRS
jgi:hypothetical protein